MLDQAFLPSHYKLWLNGKYLISSDITPQTTWETLWDMSCCFTHSKWTEWMAQYVVCKLEKWMRRRMFFCWRRIMPCCKLCIYELASWGVHREVSIVDGYFLWALCSLRCQKKKKKNKLYISCSIAHWKHVGGRETEMEGERMQEYKALIK